MDDTVEMFYLFTPDAMREATKGFDFKRALDCLEAIGALPKPNEAGERAKTRRIGSRLVRLYAVRSERLES